MEFWYVLIGITAFSLLFPYIRCFFKRLTCMTKIQKICKRKGYPMHKNHPFWLFGNKYAKRCDFYIETSNEIFAIKFFGVPRRRCVLIIKENGEYFIRRFVAMISYGSVKRFSINGKSHPMPAYDFRYRYRDEWKMKNPRNILLISPVSRDFGKQSKYGRDVIVSAGDIINGMEIDSLDRLLEDLERYDE